MIPNQVLLESTTCVLPPVVQSSPSSSEIPISPVSASSELPKRNPHQPLISYPSRLNKEKLQDKSNIYVHKFFQMFKKLHFNISLAKALTLMPKYHKMLKDLLSDKEKLLGLANTSLTENCLAVPLKKLPEKLGNPGKFLISCDFSELEKCMSLVDLGSSINLMSLSGDPSTRALVDVYGEELILRDGDKKLIFHADSTSKHPHKHGNESINMIIFIDITCEDRFEEVLKIKKSNHPFSGLTPFETSNSLLEEFTDELALLDPFPPRNKDDNFDPEADLREIKYLLNQYLSTDSLPTTDMILLTLFSRGSPMLALVYSSLPGEEDDDDDDLFDLKSDNDEWKKFLYGDSYKDLLDSDSTLPEESFESSDIVTLSSSPIKNEDKVVERSQDLKFGYNNNNDVINQIQNKTSGSWSARIPILLKGRGSPGRNKTPRPWSARIPMWQLFKGL
nr:reverse transcriptase domain-containing protein [Tanacetum cinerariifolium]GEZ42986.1 reverse transcriptase domain-containing protein [Tanacetum cinerariifolium]